MTKPLSVQEARDWLDAYGRAWVDGDPEAVASLFLPEATYRETPFDEPMVGQDRIRAYWQEGAADAQQDVRFSADVWAVEGSTVIAGWQARFRRVPSGATVELDGTFRLALHRTAGGVKCASLQEWWHRRESGAA
ncbi:MAG: nuclear transport factor 2 family protein [Paracoccaceae bacterium]|jgi:hypothetical protein